jgi:hypothetical protein
MEFESEIAPAGNPDSGKKQHALAHLGQLDEARSAAQAGLALDPTFTISRFRANVPSDNPTYLAGREHFYEGMRMAGVPEG